MAIEIRSLNAATPVRDAIESVFAEMQGKIFEGEDAFLREAFANADFKAGQNIGLMDLPFSSAPTVPNWRW